MFYYNGTVTVTLTQASHCSGRPYQSLQYVTVRAQTKQHSEDVFLNC